MPPGDGDRGLPDRYEPPPGCSKRRDRAPSGTPSLTHPTHGSMFTGIHSEPDLRSGGTKRHQSAAAAACVRSSAASRRGGTRWRSFREEDPQCEARVEVQARRLAGASWPAMAPALDCVQAHAGSIAARRGLLDQRPRDHTRYGGRTPVEMPPLRVDLLDGRLVAGLAEATADVGLALTPATAAVEVARSVDLEDRHGSSGSAGSRKVFEAAHRDDHGYLGGQFAGEAIGHRRTHGEAHHVDATGIDVGCRHEVIDQAADERNVVRAPAKGVTAAEMPEAGLRLGVDDDEAATLRDPIESGQLLNAGVAGVRTLQDDDQRHWTPWQRSGAEQQVSAPDAPDHDRRGA